MSAWTLVGGRGRGGVRRRRILPALGAGWRAGGGGRGAGLDMASVGAGRGAVGVLGGGPCYPSEGAHAVGGRAGGGAFSGRERQALDQRPRQQAGWLGGLAVGAGSGE
ncbi:hypothetical protein B1218_35215 [Pseudomonas ogarae]|nr:hypothetical protein B1218_35215 [Pseudomonas ogarae]